VGICQAGGKVVRIVDKVGLPQALGFGGDAAASREQRGEVKARRPAGGIVAQRLAILTFRPRRLPAGGSQCRSRRESSPATHRW
jgi:hypothetical protein